MKVKICGVTSARDALLAAQAGAAAVGINFFPGSPRCVSLETAEEIAASLPKGVCRVGVFVDAAREEVERLAAHLRLDAVQFHGAESPDFCRGWAQRVIKAVRVRDRHSLAQMAAYPVDFILADAYVEGQLGGTGERIPPSWLGAVASERLILAGGLTPENVAEAIRQVRPAAVDVASGVEGAPGKKDPERVRRFIANARNA